MKHNLPESHLPYTDVYFLRAKEVLKEEGMDYKVKMCFFTRQGPGRIAGIDEAIQIIHKYSPDFRKNGGKIWALREGDYFEPKEALMVIEGNQLDIIDLETMILGVISTETTLANGGQLPNLYEVESRMREIVNLVQRPIFYFGARHAKYDLDAEISKAAAKGEAFTCSTDIGAQKGFGQDKGVGTMPHSLILSFAYRYGLEKATLMASLAFDKHMPSTVPRIALIDTFNRELTDTKMLIEKLGKNLEGVRIDTCGENFGEGCARTEGKKYEQGRGVTIELAKLLRQTFQSYSRDDLKLVLSSGFGNYEKCKAFLEAEKRLGIKLFDSLGIGKIFNGWTVTSDIVEIENKPLYKNGRGWELEACKKATRLRRVEK